MMGRGCEVNVSVWYFSDLERAANRCLHRQMEVTSPGLCLYLHSDLTTQNMTRYVLLLLESTPLPLAKKLVELISEMFTGLNFIILTASIQTFIHYI